MLFLAALLLAAGCANERGRPPVLRSALPLHLEAHLDAACVEGSEPPRDMPATAEWRFDVPQPGWQPLASPATDLRLIESPGFLRVELAPTADSTETLSGALVTQLPDWRLDDWDYVLLKARATGTIHRIGLRLNRRPAGDGDRAWHVRAEEVNALNDGVEQSYLMRLDIREGHLEGALKELAIHFRTTGTAPASLDILSLAVIPKAARYAAAFGREREGRGGSHDQVVYMHVPGCLTYRVAVPEEGRLDVGLGVLGGDRPVTFSIRAAPEHEDAETLFEETWGDPDRWGRCSIDLSAFAGRIVALTLACDAGVPGTVALWAAPTLSGRRVTPKPNIILYLIDGGGADLMSAYGYPRPTTPNLERLAAAGAIFERAYSNSSWTKPATATLMTSLHYSVLGGFRTFSDPLPGQVVTLAQHLHSAGYQTAVLVSNPFAGRVSNLERGADTLRDAGGGNNSISSRNLHAAFGDWRRAYPGQPYWVHFQTTDVHSPYHPVAPFADRFLPPERRRRYEDWQRRLKAEGGWEVDSPGWERTGIPREAFHEAQRGLYEACLAHNDHQIGELVERLRAAGEWTNTLLIVTADHGVQAAGLRLPGRMPAQKLLLSAYESRIPLIVVWPGRIAPGLRFSQPVSLVDLLPTILDLADLPAAAVAQGRSLAPLLRGETGWQPEPVILDEFEIDPETGELTGLIEVIDGRWGASLKIGSGSEASPAPRPAPLLLFDLDRDPFGLQSLHGERPDLVETYTKLLRRRWQEHRRLARRFTRSEGTNLTADQLRTLRSLGYVR